MPTYDYVCSRCGNRLEVVHGIHGHGPKTCPSCGAEGTMSKAFVPPTIHFKGSGWAKKDRAATSTPGASRAKAGAASKGAVSEASTGDGTTTKSDTGSSTAPTGDAAPSGGEA